MQWPVDVVVFHYSSHHFYFAMAVADPGEGSGGGCRPPNFFGNSAFSLKCQNYLRRIQWTYTKHGPRSMDHPRGPGPWTTLWACGPGPWTTSWTRSMDHSRGPGPWTTSGPDFHRACSCTIYVGFTVLWIQGEK